jgi:dolichyl-diphosphooligosaccharide--protein glycosyltransferase
MKVSERGWRELAVLCGIVVVFLAIRLTFLRFGFLYGFDPYYHYHNAKALLEEGTVLLPFGFYTPALLLYTVLKPLGVSFYDAFRLTTPAVGALTIVFFYLLARELFGVSVARLSALTLAVLPGFITRALAGNYRGDLYAMLFYVAGFFLFFKALKAANLARTAGLSVAAGAAFALSAFVWSSGYIFAMAVLSLFILAQASTSFALAERGNKAAHAYFLSSLTGILLILAAQKFELAVVKAVGFRDYYTYIFPAVAGYALLLTFASDRIKVESAAKRAAILSCIAAIGLIAGYAIFTTPIENLMNIYGKLINPQVLRPTAETVKVGFPMLWERFSLLLLFIPLAFLHILRKTVKKLQDNASIFLLVWFAAGVFVVYKAGQRAIFTASLPVALLLGVFLVNLRTYLPKNLAHAAVAFAVGFTSVAGITFASDYAPMITPEWNESLSWLKQNIPSDARVLSWWDYGYWILAIGERSPILTPSSSGNAVKPVAELLLSTNESKLIEYMKKRRAEYLLLPTDMVAQVHNLEAILNVSDYQYVYFPFTDAVLLFNSPARLYGSNLYILTTSQGKLALVEQGGNFYAFRDVYYREKGKLVHKRYTSSEIPFTEGAVYISDNDTKLPLIESYEYVLYIPPKMQSALLNSFVLLDGEGLSNFTLVYSNPEVRIYKARYEHTFASIVPERRAYSAGEVVTLLAKLRSTIPFSGTVRVGVRNPEGALVYYGTAKINDSTNVSLSFFLPADAKEGRYRVTASLHNPKGKRVDSTSTSFMVKGREGKSFSASLEEGSSTRELIISGKLPLQGEVVVAIAGQEIKREPTSGDGSFTLAIEKPRLFRGSNAITLFTPDYSYSATVYAVVQAELVRDFTLSKAKVRRGEEVTASFAVKNTGNIALKGYLSLNPKGNAPKRIFTEDFNLPYELKPGEEAEFTHTFTVAQDAPTGKFRLWREMREENLKLWVAPKNKERKGDSALLEVVE